MSGLLFAFLATLLAGIGSRDQLTVAGIAARQGQRPGLIMTAMATSIAAAAAAAYGGALLAPLMGGDARLMCARIPAATPTVIRPCLTKALSSVSTAITACADPA